jgi:hypothetical protein
MFKEHETLLRFVRNQRYHDSERRMSNKKTYPIYLLMITEMVDSLVIVQYITLPTFVTLRKHIPRLVGDVLVVSGDFCPIGLSG